MSITTQLKDVLDFNVEKYLETLKVIEDNHLNLIETLVPVDKLQKELDIAKQMYQYIRNVFEQKSYEARIYDKLKEQDITDDEISVYLSYQTNHTFVKVHKAIENAQESFAEYLDTIMETSLDGDMIVTDSK